MLLVVVIGFGRMSVFLSVNTVITMKTRPAAPQRHKSNTEFVFPSRRLQRQASLDVVVPWEGKECTLVLWNSCIAMRSNTIHAARVLCLNFCQAAPLSPSWYTTGTL